MDRCLICNGETSKPFVAFVYHFRPINWADRKYIRGNFKTFGFWAGLRANVTLIFPFLNTILNWKYRKMHLEIEEPKP